jgi:SnoaL-like domain
MLILLLSPLTRGQSMDKLSPSEKIKYFFQQTNSQTMSNVGDFYATDADFEDPVHKLKGVEALKAYYTKLYEGAEKVTFDFSHFYEDKDTVVAIWTMTVKTPKLKAGEPIVVDGNSVIRFNSEGKASYHRDYFDLGAFIYENVPVLGFVVRKVKDRLKE